MKNFEQLKKKNDVIRFISRLNEDEISRVENFIISENFEIDTSDIDTKETIIESLNVDSAEVLTEETKEKLKVIFDSVVSQKVTDKVNDYIKESAEVVSEYGDYVKTKLEEQYKSDFETLETNLDSYLDYVISEWVTENTIALEQGVKVQLSESILTGLKRLFDDNYIDVPDEKINLISTLENKAKKLYENNISLHETNKDLNARLVALKKRMIVEELSKELTLPQKEKLDILVENVVVKNSKEFKKQVDALINVIKEEKETNLNRDHVSITQLNEGLVSKNNKNLVDPQIKKYLEAIDKM